MLFLTLKLVTSILDKSLLAVNTFIVTDSANYRWFRPRFRRMQIILFLSTACNVFLVVDQDVQLELQ